MYKIIMYIFVPLLAIAWAAYGIWLLREKRREKEEPPRKTEHLEKVKDSFADYAEKLKDYKLKPYEREEQEPGDQ